MSCNVVESFDGSNNMCWFSSESHVYFYVSEFITFYMLLSELTESLSDEMNLEKCMFKLKTEDDPSFVRIKCKDNCCAHRRTLEK